MSKTVLLETEWVLRYSYGLSRSVVARTLQPLLGYPLARIEARQTVMVALDGYLGGLDFADALHLASAAETERFLTFDRALARKGPRQTGFPPIEAI